MSIILIIDDEKNIRRSLEMILTDEGYDVVLAESGNEALKVLEKDSADLVLLDLLMPEKDGLQVLSEIKNSMPDLAVIMMSGHGSIGQAVQAVKSGAYDFIEKPLTKEKTLITVRNALEQRSLRRENRSLRLALDKSVRMVGESKPLEAVRQTIRKIAPTSARVLILGESGTGKELIAKAIHEQSPRRDKPFIKVNCAAIPAELIESELFGAVKGAYTGSVNDREGKFEQANNSTIFLDEIGDMSLSAQAKVLRILQEGELEKVGGTKTLKVDVRVIAATNKDLKALIQRGLFREDLFFRLNVVPIEVPPLRERKDDICLLINFFIQSFCREENLKPKRISDEAMDALLKYDWPGNIRELRNVAERILILSSGDTILREDLPSGIFRPLPAVSSKPLREIREETEKQFIRAALEKHNWNISAAAEELDIDRTNLHKKMKLYNLTRDSNEEVRNPDSFT